MIAVVMAGGKATRFSSRVEKATLEIRGTTLLERSLNALREGGADKVAVAVAPTTTETRALARMLGAEVVVTSGKGYHEDTLELLAEYDSFVSLNVDVPFVRGDHVRAVVSEASKGSVAAVVPLALAMGKTDADSALSDSEGRKMLWVGLNHVTPDPMNHLNVFEDPLLTININNELDLEFARRVADERGL